MKNIYKPEELKSPNFIQKLFSLQPDKNSIIEINNLFATKPIRQISIYDIDLISKKYKLDIFKKFSTEIKQIYSVYLSNCLTDHFFSEDEINDLKHIKYILSISDSDVEQLHNTIVGEIYRKKLEDVLVDGRIDAKEIEFLKNIQNQLKLPDSISNKIKKEVSQNFVDKFVKNIISDKQISDSESVELDAILKNLNITLSSETITTWDFERYKLFWLIENGQLPVIEVGINLQKNEHCYYYIVADWFENRTITKRVDYAGPSYRLKIMKGLYYRIGSVSARSITAEELRIIDSGSVYITNKRLIFMGSKKNTNIALKKILSVTPYSDGIGIEKDSGRSPVLRVATNADIFALILGRAINDL